MDINPNDPPHVIYACFVLHDFCEASRETVDDDSVEVTSQGDEDLEPLTQTDSLTDSNEEFLDP